MKTSPTRVAPARVALTVFASVCMAGPVVAPAAVGQAGIVRQADERFVLLDDFMHFTLIDRSDIADAKGKELLSLGVTPREFVELVNEVETQRRGRSFLDVTARALRRPDLEGTAGSLLDLFERGRLEQARDPEEIARNIAALSGTLRQRTYARERLTAAGEFAMPQLLEALLQGREPRLRAAAEEVVIGLERAAVVPLAEALGGLEPADQPRVANILRQIPYAASVPALLALAVDTESETVRSAALAAARDLGADASAPSVAHVQLADLYYAEPEVLTSFPGERHQLVWSFDPQIGLVPTPVDTRVYHEAMAMRHIERALDRGYDGTDALALWVASNLSREIDQPSGYVNPVYPPERREAAYFAVAAGAEACQTVLRRALEDRDTPLALRALQAIGQTAGASDISTGSAVVDALTYPDRRVQYEAALVIASVDPSSRFAGSDRVVPVLASAVRFAGERFAIVLTPETERYRSIAAALEVDGFTVLPQGDALADIAQPLSEAPGIDVIVVAAPSPSQRGRIDAIRDDARLVATPVLGLVESQAVFTLRSSVDDDPSLTFRDENLTASTLREAAKDLIAEASGGELTDSELAEYAERCVSALRDLAVSGNDVTPAGTAVLPLIAALDGSSGSIRAGIAEVLGLLDERVAQQTLVDSAMASSGADRVMLLSEAAASGRRFGNTLEPRQSSALVDLALDGGAEEATAAASVIGAMGLPGADLSKLIRGGDDSRRAGG